MSSRTQEVDHLGNRVAEITEEDLSTIFAIVKSATGHDFSSYKRNTVVRRIKRRMAVNDAADVGRYIALLREKEQEAHSLGQEILIGVTTFFRDPEAFERVRQDIIPRLFAGRDPDEPVRIWHACCSTGEEAYSTAILIREYLNERRLGTRVLLFATDIDEAALAQARAGLYSEEIEEHLGEERLKAFFTRVGGRWQVAKQLREMVVFAPHSLLKDPPFSRLDLLVCRNFLIYINPDMQKRLISLFHLTLKPGGILFLGAAETVGQDCDFFFPIDKKWKIFERLQGSRRPDALFPLTSPGRRSGKVLAAPRRCAAEEPNPGEIADRLLMERYSPPCVVVNEKYEVVHVSTRANRFLEIPVGEPTRDILKMAREELRPALRAAIYKAFTEQKEVAFRGVGSSAQGGEGSVNVLVEPLATGAWTEKMAMVIFEPAVSPPPVGGDEQVVRAEDESSKDLLIRQMEEQLRITHEQLQSVTAQLEASQEGFVSANEEMMSIHEEFQSANEELQSTNEELETSKEELQALNEELATVNAELQGKVEELDRTNTDLENLFRSSGIATVFLDRELTIKRFSPAMAEIVNLIPADLGRPFRHLAGTIDWSALPDDVRTVLTSHAPLEREVTSYPGEKHYLMRVLPYQSSEGRIDGIVVTLVDITGRKKGEEALRRNKERLKRAQEIANLGSWELDVANNSLTWSDQVYRIFGLQPQEFGATYEAFLDAVHPHDRAAVDEAYSRSLREGRASYEIEHRVVRESTGEIRHVHEKCEHFRDDTGRIVRSVGMVHDITERKRAEDALQRSYQRLDLLNDTASRLLASNSPQLVVNELCAKVMSFLDCDAFFNFLADGEAGNLRLNACAGIPEEEAQRIQSVEYGVAVCGCAARDACRIVIEDIGNTPDPRTDLVKSYGIQAYACHPLLAKGRVLGTLSFGTRSRAHFAADELALMKAVADLVAIAMERKLVEEALQKAHDELEMRVQERTAELREKNQLLLLQSRQAAMGEMINNISHQWRQPLNSLGLIVQALPMMSETGRFSQEYLEAAAEKAMQIILHMSQTIDDFRNYFKPEKERVRFSVHQPVTRTVNLIRDNFKCLNIAIDVDATGDPVIDGYPNEFAQVLLNILINARDAIVERRISDPKISIRLRSEGGRAVVTIADNAGGVPEEIIDKIFEPYFTTKGPDKGTGIGLFMSKTIIEKNMSGTLAVQNTAGGAEFRIEV